MWIFGYGSLVWRPDFPFEERRELQLDGWSRRFWQGSTDHRGVPGAPGRVATLVEGGSCWGVGFRIHSRHVDRVMTQLDYREKGGYCRQEVQIGALVLTVYFATPDNPNWLGPASIDEMAHTVCTAHGPSGSNWEYVERLVEALGPRVDAHLAEIWACCVSQRRMQG